MFRIAYCRSCMSTFLLYRIFPRKERISLQRQILSQPNSARSQTPRSVSQRRVQLHFKKKLFQNFQQHFISDSARCFSTQSLTLRCVSAAQSLLSQISSQKNCFFANQMESINQVQRWLRFMGKSSKNSRDNVSLKNRTWITRDDKVSIIPIV